MDEHTTPAHSLVEGAGDQGTQRRVALNGSLWAELNNEEHAAAMQLGYYEALWDAGGTPHVCSFIWSQLASHEQAAATLLGYDEFTWNGVWRAKVT